MSQTPETNSPDSTQDAAPVAISLWSQLSVVLRQRQLVIVLPALVALVAGVLAFTSERKYLASAKFTPQELPTLGAGLGQLASQLGVTPGRVGTYSPQFYADLVISREILRDVVLTQYTDTTNGFNGTLQEFFGVQGATPELRISRAVTALRAAVLPKADRNNVVTVEMRLTSPVIALQATNRLLALVNDFNLNRRQSQARSEREFVERRLQVAKAELAAAEDSVAAFTKRNRALIQAPDLQAQAQRLTREVNVRQQVYMQLAQSYEASRIEEVRSTPLITVLERPEGFVAAQSKRTVTTAMLAWVVSVIVALIVAYFRDGASRGNREGDDYTEFRRLADAFWRDVKRSPLSILRAPVTS